MPAKVPQEFYDMVDRFIAVANEMTAKHPTSRVDLQSHQAGRHAEYADQNRRGVG